MWHSGLWWHPLHMGPFQEWGNPLPVQLPAEASGSVQEVPSALIHAHTDLAQALRRWFLCGQASFIANFPGVNSQNGISAHMHHIFMLCISCHNSGEAYLLLFVSLIWLSKAFSSIHFVTQISNRFSVFSVREECSCTQNTIYIFYLLCMYV